MAVADVARRTRLQERLHATFPLYQFIGLEVEQLGDRVVLRAPLSPANTNHFGVMHAGVLFTLSEAAGGLAVTQHRDLGALTLIATSIKIDYVQVARTPVRAAVSLSPAFLASLRANLAADPKHAFTVTVDVFDEAGAVVARSQCTFQLRARR